MSSWTALLDRRDPPPEEGAKNIQAVHIIWYVAAGVLGSVVLARLFSVLRRKISRNASDEYTAVTQHSNIIARSWSRLIFAWRSLTNLDPRIRRPSCLSWLSPPPLGRVLAIIAYEVLIATLSFTNISLAPLELLGYRSGSVATAQLPLVLLLASRLNPLGLAGDRSAEQLNWAHRWVARTFLVSSTLHGVFFAVQYARADLFWAELRAMPRVTIGIYAWFVLVWIGVSSALPLRRLSYDFFVVQHNLSVVAFLYMLVVHAGRHHRGIPLVGAGIFAVDAVARLGYFVFRSARVRKSGQCCNCKGGFGYEAELRAVNDDVTVIDVKGVRFRWQAGQHVLVWLPALWSQTPHPVTIAQIPKKGDGDCCQTAQLIFRTKRGFTKKLNQLARRRAQDRDGASVRAIIAGPFGRHHDWTRYQTVILVSASTGASLSLPIFESLLATAQEARTERLFVLLIARKSDHLEAYKSRLYAAAREGSATGIAIDINMAITRGQDTDETFTENGIVSGSAGEYHFANQDDDEEKLLNTPTTAVRTSIDSVSSRKSAASDDTLADIDAVYAKSDGDLGSSLNIQETFGRPNITSYINAALANATGEAAVSACGGKDLVAGVRNAVARISAGRASAANEADVSRIVLHVEEFGD